MREDRVLFDAKVDQARNLVDTDTEQLYDLFGCVVDGSEERAGAGVALEGIVEQLRSFPPRSSRPGQCRYLLLA